MSNNIRKVGLTKGVVKYTKDGTDDLFLIVKRILKELDVPYADDCCEGDSNYPGYLGNYAQFISLTTQQAVQAGIPQAVMLEETIYSKGITMELNNATSPYLSRITFSNPGVYNIQFSGQLFNGQGGQGNEVHIWFRQNGIDIPDSNTQINIANNTYAVAAWNIFVKIDNPGEYVEMVGYPDDTTIKLVYQAAVTNPVPEPAVPSVILTVNQVG